MNLLTQSKKTTILPVLMAVALACFGLSPDAGAKPGEDRGNGNSAAEHVDALNLGSTGSDNTAHGWFSLSSNTSGSSNTADGFKALYSNTTGADNTAVGFDALFSNETGTVNTAIGHSALFSNTTGSRNTAVGNAALLSNDSTGVGLGNDNTAVGSEALSSNVVGFFNTAVGSKALFSNDSTGGGFAVGNTAVGALALRDNVDGASNTAVGRSALILNVVGQNNTAVGDGALFNNDSTGSALGHLNTAVGVVALGSNTDGAFNVGVGAGAGGGITTGDANIVIGDAAGPSIGAGSGNVYIGDAEGPLFAESNTTRIADNSSLSPAAQCFIGGIVGAPNFVDTVKINPATGQLGDQPSSARFKKDIAPMDKSSEAIFSLKPVTFHYKNDKTNTACFGLIAEEVERVNPALIAVDKEGKPYTVAYDKINAMLLNEFLKQHRKVEKLEATVAKQHKDFEAALADLNGQIQKMSAQLELNKPATKTVLNNR